jgi:hypothetical protein
MDGFVKVYHMSAGQAIISWVPGIMCTTKLAERVIETKTLGRR